MDPDEAPADFDVEDLEPRRPSRFVEQLVEYIETGEVVDGTVTDDEPGVTPDP